MENFSHVIMIDPQTKTLKIYRLLEGNRREFFTECSIDGISAQKDWDKFSQFAQQLGENILMDNPSARELMDI